ncbi:hypothetical protein Purlil1_13534 [Purpureocillium lilacinum]|uniref:Copper transport protein n=1 Tax=Purpureocillium lilacinum TaxID=33203 RepID=A0ABR0BDT7_PURLI|nr:hypothetical protein Purlil1_13534 [Purpureocillium lilacinum]
MDMGGMKNMPGMETTSSVTVATASPRLTVATRASAQTPLASGASETAHREGVAANELPNDTSMASMSGMSNALHFGLGDTLWAKPMTPTNGQGYFGAILLLISMTLLLRFLVIARGRAERRWNSGTPRRCKGVEANDFIKVAQPRKDEADASSGETWSAKIQFTRAAFTLATTSIGYLLMLAVMTLNLGYLLAVLGGGVLGELALGWLEQ